MIGIDAVDAVGRDLNRHVVDDDGNSPVLQTGFDDMKITKTRAYLLRLRIGRAVPVMWFGAPECIAHTAADDISFKACTAERIKRFPDRCRRCDMKICHGLPFCSGTAQIDNPRALCYNKI